MNWKEVYNNRKNNYDFSDVSVENLLKISGYDNKNSFISYKELLSWINNLKKEINFNEKNDTVLELCCGAGAFIKTFNPLWGTGLDFSEDMCKIFSKANPSYNIINSEALLIDETFDHIFTFTGFNYFPSKEYSEKVLRKIISLSSKTISILDILDVEKEKDEKEFRKETIENYEENYSTISHLYYSKDWFEKILKESNVTWKYIPGIKSYHNSQFRFNLVIYK